MDSASLIFSNQQILNSDSKKALLCHPTALGYRSQKSKTLYSGIVDFEDSEEIRNGHCQNCILESYLAFLIGGKKNPNRLFRK